MIPAVLFTTFGPVTFVKTLFRLSHSLWKTKLSFELRAKGIRLAMAESVQNCCKLLTSVEMSQGDTNKNVLAEFPSSLRYCATNILTDGVDKRFVRSHFSVLGSFPLKIRLRNLSSSSGSFSFDVLSISSMVGGQGISFDDLNALRTTSFMKVATSFNLFSEAARYDAFEIDISELKTS